MKRRKRMAGRHLGLQAVSLCISTTMVLILLGLVVASVLTARSLSTFVRENMSVSLVLGDTVSVSDGQALVGRLQARPFARQVRYVSADEALAVMTEELGANPVEFAGVNPFQSEIEIQLAASYANADSLNRLALSLKADSLITDVYYARDEIDAADKTLNYVNLVLLVLSALLIFICYTLISNSVQLGVYARRFTIHTMKLVGARWSFIRRPFLVRSIIIGFVSSLLASAVLVVIGYSLYRYQNSLAQLITWSHVAITIAAVFVFGFAIMLFCTLVSVNKFLRMTAGELYKN
ncbi:MAG: permease-like cell division protein FtsX [Prevotella sp.]|nr:permease-like cell division protein FtsX [Prevotella sp.]